MPLLTRRAFVSGAMASGLYRASGQGITARKVMVQPRGAPSGRPFSCSFVDVSKAAGLTQPTLYGGVTSKRYILETIGCGCAFLDYDNDGWMDLLVLAGSSFTQPSKTASTRLYRNNRDGTFRDVTAEAGLLLEGWSCGVCIGDYNNDGFADIFLTRWEHNVLYRNNGDGTFTDVTRQAGLLGAEPRWGTGCSFVDTNRNGHLDLFVSNYARFDLATAPLPGHDATCRFGEIPVNCGPRGLSYGQHSLYRNNGDGTFTDVSETSGIGVAKNSYGLTVVTGDFDDDGWPDIYVACDSSPSLLFMNNRDGTFREEATERGVAYSGDGEEQAGMGVVAAGFAGTPCLDIFKTNFEADLPNLYRNTGKGDFTDVAKDCGLAVDNRFVCWGAGIEDFDNDGAPDILVVTGHVFPEVEKVSPEHAFKGPRLLYRNLGSAKFEEIQAGQPALTVPHASRGCAFGDFDNDGDIDVLIVNLNEPPTLLRNDVSGANHWIKIKLQAVHSNRSAIGAKVVVNTATHTLVREVQSQSSFLSCNDSRLHFGLGADNTARVHVRWPDGQWSQPRMLKADQLHVLREDTNALPSSRERSG